MLVLRLGYFTRCGARDRLNGLEDNIGFTSAALPSRMHFPSHEQKQALLEQVLRIADQRLSTAAAKKEARNFLAHYYRPVDVEDLQTRSGEDPYGAAMADLGFARRFFSRPAKIRL